MHDDEAVIRRVVCKLVEEEQNEVVMVLHSAGGFLGTAAIEGLSRKERNVRELLGGVVGFVFLSAAVMDVGHVHATLPFFDINTESGEMYCVEPERSLFNDINEEETAKWMKEIRCQPAGGWNATTEYAAWKDVPSVYLICEKDQTLPKELQLHFARLAKSKIETCAAGHMPMLSVPDKVVKVIIDAAKEYSS